MLVLELFSHAAEHMLQVNIFLTYMGDRYMELEDVDNVHLKLHPMVYTNKTWTPRKLLLRIRRDVILDILSQVGHSDAVHDNRRVCTGTVTSLECFHTLWLWDAS